MMFYGVSSSVSSSVSFVSWMRRTAAENNNNHGRRRATTTAQKKNLRREVVSSCGGSSRGLREERRRRSAHAKRREKKIEEFSSSPLWVANAGSSANAESEFYAAQDARHKAFLVANELKKKKKVPKIVKRTVSALVLGVLAAFFLGFGGWLWVALIGLCAYASGDGVFRVDVESERGAAAPAAEVGGKVDNRVFGVFVRNLARLRGEIATSDDGYGCRVFLRGCGVNFERRVALH